MGAIPLATAAAAPPLDPPGVSSESQGLCVGPNRSLSVMPEPTVFGRVRLADQDRAGSLQAIDRGSVLGRDPVGVHP